MSRRFVLVDRDGTLVVEKNYLSDPDEVQLIANAGLALRLLSEAGWGICVVTNQSGIARGYVSLAQLEAIHSRMVGLLAQQGARVDGIYVCPHAPNDRCNCRKPLPGMVEQAALAHGFDPSKSWVIGDKEIDVALARSVRARSVLVRTGFGRRYERETKADHIADDILEAASVVLSDRT